MKVTRLHANGEFRLHEEESPTSASDEALVQVKVVGVCGSDLLWYQTAGIGDARLSRPLVLGHEFTGILEIGKRMVADPAVRVGSAHRIRKEIRTFVWHCALRGMARRMVLCMNLWLGCGVA